MKITFLGTGTSCGVPVLGCGCRVCTSGDPRDRRLRCSAMVETDATRILIDCGPDFRQQMMDRPFRRIDGILLTHHHYDHVGGIDDLRPYCRFGDIAIYAGKATADSLRHTIPYCFVEERYPGVPGITLNQISPHTAFTIGDIEVMPLQVMHGAMPILGYRLGDVAYITDMKTIGDGELRFLHGVKVLIVNALRFEKPHHSHQLVGDAVEFSRSVGAARTYLIHLNHHIGLHEEACRLLPEGVTLAYDGLKIDI